MHAIVHTSHTHTRPTSRLAAIADFGLLPLRDQDSDAVAVLKLLYHVLYHACTSRRPGRARRVMVAARPPPLGC